MRVNTTLKKIYAVTITCIVLFVSIVLFVPKDSVGDSSILSKASISSVNSQKKVNRKLPVRLSVPKINVDADIEYVSAKESGEMEAPKNYSSVAWFSPGEAPGEIGSAVIAGHFDQSDGKPSIFYNLKTLEVGDKIGIENNDGSKITFTVKKIESLDYTADASDIFSSDDGKAHLNLVTCGGVWDKNKKTYTKRLVVFAEVQKNKIYSSI